MAKDSKPLVGYVKTSNVYLAVLMALSVGFLGGVLFSSYRSTALVQSTGGMPAPATSGQPAPAGNMPFTQDQSQTLATLLDATKATPDDVGVWTKLGHFYFDSGRTAEAIDAYKKSLALDDNRPDVWTDLGVMYRRSDNPQKAIECFDRALSINSKHEASMFNKGVVFMHDLKDTKAALAAWEELVRTNPGATAPSGQLVSTLISELKKRQ